MPLLSCRKASQWREVYCECQHPHKVEREFGDRLCRGLAQELCCPWLQITTETDGSTSHHCKQTFSLSGRVKHGMASGSLIRDHRHQPCRSFSALLSGVEYRSWLYMPKEFRVVVNSLALIFPMFLYQDWCALLLNMKDLKWQTVKFNLLIYSLTPCYNHVINVICNKFFTFFADNFFAIISEFHLGLVCPVLAPLCVPVSWTLSDWKTWWILLMKSVSLPSWCIIKCHALASPLSVLPTAG